MGIFSKENKDTLEEGAFTRTVLHQALSFSTHSYDPYWTTVNLLLIHVEVSGRSFLKLFYNEETFEAPMDSSQVAYNAIEKIRIDPSNLPGLFPSAKFEKFTDESYSRLLDTSESLGFLNPLLENDRAKALDMMRGKAAWPGLENLDSLSCGNFLATLFDDPNYFPSCEEEVNFIWNYLAKFERSTWGAVMPSSNFTIGYFGNFKHVLKSLTERFEKILENAGSSELVSQVAGCLGSGYGHVDAYLSKGHLIPMSVMQDSYHRIYPIIKLQEFGGRAYPSLATAQYLSRKGVRLLKLIEANCSSLVTTRFKINALNTADVLDERSSKFSEYQILVNRIVFGESSGKLQAGRKTSIPEDADFQILGQGFSTTFGEEESEIIKSWTENIAGNNAIVTKLAFELSQEVGSTFPLNVNTINSLSLSNSARARKVILDFISANPDKLLWVHQSTLASFLADLPDGTIQTIFDQYFQRRWVLFNEWASYCENKKLSLKEIEISKLFLSKGFTSGISAVAEFLIQLAEQTQFSPFDEWKSLVSLKDRLWVTTQNLLDFLGADPAKEGIFNVIKTTNIELAEVYANDLALTLKWDESWTWGVEANQVEVNEALGKLFSSPIENLRNVASLLISKKLLNQSQVSNFYSSLTDPKLMFEILKYAVHASDETTIAAHLNDLSREDKGIFWRMFSSEAERLFAEWTSFPKFFWSNVALLPTYVIEVFKAYNWLPDKLRNEISPSSVAKLDGPQANFFVGMLKSRPDFLEDARLLKALLIAPDAQINQFGASYVKQNGMFADYWLVMLESNLPVTSRAAELYLESQVTSKDFEEKVMMALDSNNKFARSSTLRILQSANSPRLLTAVIQKLSENRNQDTWSVVAANMNLIEEAKNLQTFTRRVFLSRRKARSQKEQVKRKIATLVRDLSEVVEQDILVRMSLGAVAKDRDWALRQIALSGLVLEDVQVEFTWKAGTDV